MVAKLSFVSLAQGHQLIIDTTKYAVKLSCKHGTKRKFYYRRFSGASSGFLTQ